jgi:hypothetical protein
MNYEKSITNYELRKINYKLIKMRNNQTNQGCVGTNLRQKREIILRFSAYSAGKENNLPQNSQKYAELAEKDK